jgi:transposase
MFLAKTKKIYKGKLHNYAYIVENYREAGKIKRRIIASLGELSQREIDNIMRGLNSLKEKPSSLESLSVSHENVFSYGDVFLLNEVWKKIGIGEIITENLSGRRVKFDVSASAFLMVANRCIEPDSKLKVWEWQDKIWLSGMEKIDYHKILRTLDYLKEIKNEVEEKLFQKQVDLFHQKVDMVFYDITSSYFEGIGPDIAKKGYSSDKRPDCNQILLALAITKDGLPIGHEVYQGNKKQSKTVPDLVDKLRSRFNIDKCIIVADRGMVSVENIEKVKACGYDYIFALRKRRIEEVKGMIKEDLEEYKTIIGKDGAIKLYYREETRDGVRYIICHNPEIAVYSRKRLGEKIFEKGEELREIFESYKDPGVIIKHIARIPDIDRYYKYWLDGKEVRYKENTESIKYEELIAGKWILKTEEETLSCEDIIFEYKNLSEIERAFRTIKNFLDLRPMYHRDDNRVEGHVFVCILGYYLQKVIEKMLQGKGKEMSGQRAIEKLGEIKLIKSKISGRSVFQAIELKKEHKTILSDLDVSPILSAQVL